MKRLMMYTWMLLTLFAASCQKDLSPVLGDPDERLNEVLKSHKEQLVSAEHGWNGYLFTKLGGGYSFHFVFHEDGRVEMVGDLMESTVTEVNESTWRLKSSQQSLLIFDTYSYLHLLADPNRNVFEGQPGLGYGSDYEFAFLESIGDTLRFRGKLNSTDFYMVKATPQDVDNWKTGKVLRIADKIKKNRFASSASGSLKFMVNTEKKTVVFEGTKHGQFISIPYTYSNMGLSLQKSFQNDQYAFSEINWDDDQQVYYIQSHGQREDLTVAPSPLFPLAPMLGYGKEFSTIDFNGDQLATNLSVGLNSRWKRAKENNLLYMGPPLGRILLDYAVMRFLKNNEVSVHFRYKHPVDGTLFTVGIWYRIKENPDGTMKLVYLRQDNNTLFNDARIMEPFTSDFFAAKTFRIDWVDDPDPSASHLIAGLYVNNDPSDFFYGVSR